MKKFLIGILTILTLTGCGSNFQYESKEEKKEFLIKLLQTEDKKLQQEYNDIIKDLESQNNEKALAQLRDWRDLYFSLSSRHGKEIDTSNKSSGLRNLLEGKNIE
ncbi:Uncharacterised protein [Fusobacterium necrogenes]|uniref:Lipoprotein n=1 Tax=Fusobacterium necrogenes TaxID=858 RepID=A0A377GP25_9FUSO|nr:hypothetical protein [Fusobacterium necrogenes]STO28730.1 Uncharacterised protein [Fusobacterium necrogenes]